MDTKNLQKIVKGFANHRRIRIMELLDKSSGISLTEISQALKVNLKTISEHTRRLSQSGIVSKNYKGRVVIHKLSEQGSYILTFLRKLE